MEGHVRYYRGTHFIDHEPLPITTHGVPIVPRKGEAIIFDGFEYKVVDVFWRFKSSTVTVYASLDAERFEYGPDIDAGRVEEGPRTKAV